MTGLANQAMNAVRQHSLVPYFFFSLKQMSLCLNTSVIVQYIWIVVLFACSFVCDNENSI